MHALSKIFLLFLLLLEVSCSNSIQNTRNALQEHIHIDTQNSKIILDTAVNKSPVQVYVHPNSEPQKPLSALFVPFRMMQNIENFVTIGRNISYIIWQNWLQQELFSILEFSQTTPPFRPDIALAIAAEKGADLVIGGYVTEFIDGGTVGDTRVAIAIEIYDVKTKNLIWSIAQAGSIEITKANDYILFTINKRIPTNPSSVVIYALAEGTGKTIKNWISPQPGKAPWYKFEPSAF